MKIGMVLWGLAVAALITCVLAINIRPFIGAEARIRVSDLDFAPSPELSVALALGHRNSVSRLRWIDSLAYLQLQFDRRDDHLADGSSGFSRLYDGLLALDERFLPFYQQSSLAVGGIAGRPYEAFGYLMRGLIVAPKDFALWQHAAAMLVVDFDIERNNPDMFNQFLTSWAAAMDDEGSRNGVWQWQAALARRRFSGLEHIGYWRERLFSTTAGTPMSDFIEGILRDQIARYGCAVLQKVVDARLAAGLPVTSIADVLDAERLNAAGSDVTWGPVAIGAHGEPILRDDPWGWPWILVDGRVESFGTRLQWYRNQIERINGGIASRAADEGRWPRDQSEAVEWVERMPNDVAGVTLSWSKQRFQVEVRERPGQPWPLR